MRKGDKVTVVQVTDQMYDSDTYYLIEDVTLEREYDTMVAIRHNSKSHIVPKDLVYPTTKDALAAIVYKLSCRMESLRSRLLRTDKQLKRWQNELEKE